MKRNSLQRSCFVFIFLFAFFVMEVQAQDTTSVFPLKNILSKLQFRHPRLLARPEDFINLKKRIAEDSTLKVWYEKLKIKGENVLVSVPCTYELSNGKLLNVSRKVLDRVYTLIMLYQLNGDKRYSERVWQELESAARFPDWNPSHFLDVAEMTHAFAIAYDWLYQIWTDNQRSILQTAIITKGLNEARKVYEGKVDHKKTFWTNSKNNWNLVCNSGIGLGAIAIARKDPELAKYILQHVLSALPIAMRQFAPDGAWSEGPEYWALATRYIVIFLASLENAFGEDFGMQDIDGFSHTGIFPVYMNGPTNKCFNFSDAVDSAVSGFQLLWLANKFNLPSAVQIEKELVKVPHALDLLWLPANKLTDNKELPLSAYFRSTEVVTMRSAWNNKNAWFVGFKAGDNKAGHSHLDLGSFVLDALGKRWAVDLGKESYSLPNYFDDGINGVRWTYYRIRAEGHNTLVINPGNKPDQNPLAESKIVKFEASDNNAFAIADLTPAYAENAFSVYRGIALVKGKSVIIQDEIKTITPSDLYWFMHTPAQISIQPNSRSAILTIGKEQIEADIVYPAKAFFSVLPAAPLASSPQPNGINKNVDILKLSIYLNNVKEERIVVEFHQIEQKDTSVLAFYKPLNEWKILDSAVTKPVTGNPTSNPANWPVTVKNKE